MAEEDAITPVASDEAEVVTVDDNDDADGTKETKADEAEAAMEAARSQAEARRKRILEKANNRMKYVNGEQVGNEAEKNTSNSNAARIRAARQRRYGKKSKAAANPSTTPATTSNPETETSAAVEASTSLGAPETEPEKVESDANKEEIVEAPIETTASPEDTTASATTAEPTTKKKYLGVARTRRKMLARKKMEEENSDAGASTANSDSAAASLSSKGKPAVSSGSVGRAGLSSVNVQTVPIYMHMIVILLLFAAGFDVGIQQFHVDVDVRTQVAVQEYGVPVLHRNPWHPLKPIKSGRDSKATLEEMLSSSTSSSTAGGSEDEFEETDEEYIPPNIDPIFRVDLDELTKGPGFVKQMARGAISIHRLLLWIIYYAPMGIFVSILSIPSAFIQSPPGLFLAAVILRQVVGKGVGAAIPDDSADEGADGAKQNNIEVIAMAKNFVKNFFVSTFPNLVKFYDAYLHLKSDMYVVLCGVFFGLAWTHLQNDALSCDADAVVGGGDVSEGEL